MFTLLWNMSAALRGYLRFFMPTNRAVDWLCAPRGVKWAIPFAVVAASAYFLAMSVCATVVERGGSEYLKLLVLLFAWNAMKFAFLGVLTPVRWFTWGGHLTRHD